MKPVHFIVAAVLGVAPMIGIVRAQAQSTGFTAPARPSPQAFAEAAAIASMFSIAGSQAALARSADYAVRRYAAELIADYQRGNVYLANAAADAKLLPPQTLDLGHQSRLDTLRTAPADQFDFLYMSEMAEAHQTAITVFTNYLTFGEDPQLKTFASLALPTLKEHYSSARQQLAGR